MKQEIPRKPKVIIVDDDRDTREMLTLALELEGFDVGQAANGLRLISAMHVDRPDVILLDVMMSWIDGFELCRAIKKNATFHDIPVIFVSARKSAEGVMFDAKSRCGTRRETTSRSRVLPDCLVAELIVSRGEMGKASSACVWITHSATASAPWDGKTTKRFNVTTMSLSRAAPFTVSGQGSGSSNITGRPWPVPSFCFSATPNVASISRAGALIPICSSFFSAASRTIAHRKVSTP